MGLAGLPRRAGRRAARRATAKRLGIHQNTVAYRLGQCEDVLGRPIKERRVELEAALHLRHRMHLAPRPDDDTS